MRGLLPRETRETFQPFGSQQKGSPMTDNTPYSTFSDQIRAMARRGVPFTDNDGQPLSPDEVIELHKQASNPSPLASEREAALQRHFDELSDALSAATDFALQHDGKGGPEVRNLATALGIITDKLDRPFPTP